MELTKWLRLFEIEPELEPPELELVLPDADGWSWRIAGQLMGDSGCISDEVAAALIRDRAVLRLAEQDWSLVNDGNWAVRYRFADEYGVNEALVSGCDDPTEALYLAWCKVLEVTP